MRQNTNPTGRIEWPNLADDNLQQQQMTVDSWFFPIQVFRTEAVSFSQTPRYCR